MPLRPISCASLREGRIYFPDRLSDAEVTDLTNASDESKISAISVYIILRVSVKGEGFDGEYTPLPVYLVIGIADEPLDGLDLGAVV